MTRHKKEPRYFLIGGQGGDDTEPKQLIEGEYVVRDIPKVAEETIPATAGPSKPTILPMISDAQIDMLYSMMSSIDTAQSRFRGSKREYVLKMHEIMSAFMTQQAINGIGLFPDTRAKATTPMVGRGSTLDRTLYDQLITQYSDVGEYSVDALKDLQEHYLGIETEYRAKEAALKYGESLKPVEQDEYNDAHTHGRALMNVLRTRKGPAKPSYNVKKVADELEPEPEPEPTGPPTKEDAARVFYETFTEAVTDVFGDVKTDRTTMIDLFSRIPQPKTALTTLKELSSAEFAKQIADNLAATKMTLKKATRTMIEKKQTTRVDEVADKTIREHIVDTSSSLMFDDISSMAKMYKLFVTGMIQSTGRGEHNPGQPFYDLITKNLVNYTLYPYITDFNYISGIGSLCRRFMLGGLKFNGEQSKVGEFFLRSQHDWMDEFMFLGDKYNLVEVAFKQDIVESDSLDLQEFIRVDGGYLTYLGEIKTFHPKSDVTVQYTKMLMFVTMLSEYEKAETETKAGREYKPQVTLKIYGSDEERTMYFPKLGKDGKYPYVPFAVNLFNLDGCYEYKDIKTADAMPITLVYDALEMAKDMRRLVFPDGSNMFDKMRGQVSKYLYINDRGRIYRPKQTETATENPYFTAYRQDTGGNNGFTGEFVLGSFDKADQVRDVKFSYSYLNSTGRHYKNHIINKKPGGKPTKAYNKTALVEFLSGDVAKIKKGQKELLTATLLDTVGYANPKYKFAPGEFDKLYGPKVSEEYFRLTDKVKEGVRDIKPSKEILAATSSGTVLPPAPFDKFAEWLKAPRDGLKPDGEKDTDPATESDSRDIKNSVVDHKNIIELMKSYHTEWLNTMPKDVPTPTIDYFYQWLKDNKLKKTTMPAHDAPEGLYWYTPRKYVRTEVDKSSYFDFGNFRYKVGKATIPNNPNLISSRDISMKHLLSLLSSAKEVVNHASVMGIDITTEPYKGLVDYINETEEFVKDKPSENYDITPLIAKLGNTRADALAAIKAAKVVAVKQKAKKVKADARTATKAAAKATQDARKAKIQMAPEAAAAGELFPVYTGKTKTATDNLASYNSIRPKLNALQRHPVPLTKEEEETLEELRMMVTPAMFDDQTMRRAFIKAAENLLKKIDERREKVATLKKKK